MFRRLRLRVHTDGPFAFNLSPYAALLAHQSIQRSNYRCRVTAISDVGRRISAARPHQQLPLLIWILSCSSTMATNSPPRKPRPHEVLQGAGEAWRNHCHLAHTVRSFIQRRLASIPQTEREPRQKYLWIPLYPTGVSMRIEKSGHKYFYGWLGLRARCTPGFDPKEHRKLREV